MPEKEKMILLTEAQDVLERELAAITLAVETVPVRKALGRTLTEDQTAHLDLPPFNKSAMDGYAVLAGDQREAYHLIEVVAAGKTPCQKLLTGTTIKVMTGAPVPEGTGQVIMVEQTREANGKVHIKSHSRATNICPKGEDVQCGDLILKAPVVLGPLEIANLISVGISEVRVFRPVRMAILATGNEIVDSADKLAPGKIMNSNGPILEALCRKYSFDVVANTIVPDNKDATISEIRKVLENADIVLLSGGVSIGDFDFVADAMGQVGLKVHFNRLAVKPGKPMTFATSGEKIAFGLPGNPVAVFLMFHLFVLHAARLIAGMKPQIHYVTLPLASDFRRQRAERMAFLPCQLTLEGTLKPVDYHGTAHLLALLDCDGFFIVPKDVTEIHAGDKVSYLSIKDSFE